MKTTNRRREADGTVKQVVLGLGLGLGLGNPRREADGMVKSLQVSEEESTQVEVRGTNRSFPIET